MATDLSEEPHSPSAKRRKVEDVAEKTLLDLPPNLMHEVFGPLDARSLLETANAHPVLRKHVDRWPGKDWQIVYRTRRSAIIDYEQFTAKEAKILLMDARFQKEIYELPYELLWQIMEPLGEKELLALAKCHPNLLRATRNLKNKRFDTVEWLSEGVVFWANSGTWPGNQRGPIRTHVEAEVLLSGAHVHSVIAYDVQTNITPDGTIHNLTFNGYQKDAHRCAELIRKWKPAHIYFLGWDAEAFSSALSTEWPLALKEVRRLRLGTLSVEWLSYIPDWDFVGLEFRLDTGGKNVTSQLEAMCQKLYERWISFERNRFLINITVDANLVGSFEVDDISTSLGAYQDVKRSDGISLHWRVGAFHFTMFTDKVSRR